jgi:hypothetical protein
LKNSLYIVEKIQRQDTKNNIKLVILKGKVVCTGYIKFCLFKAGVPEIFYRFSQKTRTDVSARVWIIIWQKTDGATAACSYL